MIPKPSTVLDPERAIWEKDLAELERALDAGWTLPRARTKEGGAVKDLALVIRVVSLRWTEGWLALARAFPNLRESPVLWTLALRQAVPGVVKDMLEHGQSATEPLDNGLLPVHAVMEAMGPRPGVILDGEDLLATFRLLESAGADPFSPNDSGSFVAGDTSLHGHNLWSRAMYFGCWEVARAYQPGSWEEVLALPRGLEMVNDLHRVRLSKEDPGAARMWLDLATQWLGPWLAANPNEVFARPEEVEVLPRLAAPVRQHVWNRWSEVDSLGWTGLHEIALSGKDVRIHHALAVAVADGASCLDRWAHPDTSGMRPCDLWEIANGRVTLDSPCPVSELPEVRAATL